jgi:hypothetical protein
MLKPGAIDWSAMTWRLHSSDALFLIERFTRGGDYRKRCETLTAEKDSAVQQLFEDQRKLERLAPMLSAWLVANTRISPHIFIDAVVEVDAGIDALFYSADGPDLPRLRRACIAAEQVCLAIEERIGSEAPKDEESKERAGATGTGRNSADDDEGYVSFDAVLRVTGWLAPALSKKCAGGFVRFLGKGKGRRVHAGDVMREAARDKE